MQYHGSPILEFQLVFLHPLDDETKLDKQLFLILQLCQGQGNSCDLVSARLFAPTRAWHNLTIYNPPLSSPFPERPAAFIGVVHVLHITAA